MSNRDTQIWYNVVYRREPGQTEWTKIFMGKITASFRPKKEYYKNSIGVEYKFLFFQLH